MECLMDGTPEPATRTEKKLFRYENDLGKTDEKTAHVGQFADT